MQEEQRVSHLGVRALIWPSGALKRQKAIKAVRAIRLKVGPTVYKEALENFTLK